MRIGMRRETVAPCSANVSRETLGAYTAGQAAGWKQKGRRETSQRPF
jgi:hypothetical protein